MIAAGLLLPFPLPAKDYSVVSPDGTITLSVRVEDAVTLTVACDGREVVSGLTPAMQMEGETLPGTGSAVIRSATSRVSEMLVPVVPHKNSTCLLYTSPSPRD